MISSHASIRQALDIHKSPNPATIGDSASYPGTSFLNQGCRISPGLNLQESTREQYDEEFQQSAEAIAAIPHPQLWPVAMSSGSEPANLMQFEDTIGGENGNIKREETTLTLQRIPETAQALVLAGLGSERVVGSAISLSPGASDGHSNMHDTSQSPSAIRKGCATAEAISLGQHRHGNIADNGVRKIFQAEMGLHSILPAEYREAENPKIADSAIDASQLDFGVCREDPEANAGRLVHDDKPLDGLPEQPTRPPGVHNHSERSQSLDRAYEAIVTGVQESSTLLAQMKIKDAQILELQASLAKSDGLIEDLENRLDSQTRSTSKLEVQLASSLEGQGVHELEICALEGELEASNETIASIQSDLAAERQLAYTRSAAHALALELAQEHLNWQAKYLTA